MRYLNHIVPYAGGGCVSQQPRRAAQRPVKQACRQAQTEGQTAHDARERTGAPADFTATALTVAGPATLKRMSFR